MLLGDFILFLIEPLVLLKLEVLGEGFEPGSSHLKTYTVLVLTHS